MVIVINVRKYKRMALAESQPLTILNGSGKMPASAVILISTENAIVKSGT
jgi:hypothetical protein